MLNIYVRQVGFVVHVMQHRCSGINDRTSARQLGYNKQEFSRKQQGNIGARKRPMHRARGGCKATVLV
jgi:hypothetical protein